MGTFKSSKTFYASPSLIPDIAEVIKNDFLRDGYEVDYQILISGGCDMSITKGGVFKAVLGMKSALKVNIQPSGNQIFIEAGVGIFGQQAIPSFISLFLFWPVLLTQIWGMVQQSKLDDRVMIIAENYINANHSKTPYANVSASGSKFCVSCGKQLSEDAVFCSGCGTRQ